MFSDKSFAGIISKKSLLILPYSITGRQKKCLYTKVLYPNSIAVPNKENSTTGADGVTRVAKVSVPSLTMYKPAKANGMAIIICPGGGYSILAIDKEGTKVLKNLINGVLLHLF
jgi:hypothetical protein